MSKQANFGSRTSSDTVLEGKDLSSKNIIITGANTGIGYEAAKALAAVGANVVLACRSDDKGLAAVANIKNAQPNAKVKYQSLDLSSVASIQSFCQTLPLDTIDIIICNAGVVPTGYQETAEGVEQCVGVCHFGHFALCKLLLPKVLKSTDPRIVMVSSESHRSPKTLNFDKFPLNKNNFKIFTAYGQAKLCNALFANELQRRYDDQGLSACSLHPGALITTDIGRNSGVFSVLMKLISPLTKNPNQGASTTVYCAAYARHEDIQGAYFSHCKKVRSSKEANDPNVASKLWDISETFCKEHGLA
jgi:WW domain-containing oxidoreductase